MDRKIDDLSILITSYNNAQYIANVIDRVRVNFPDAQIIIVDDQSNDGSWKILVDNYLWNKNTYIFKNWGKNRGYGYTLKRCAKIADNKYIAFQDSDMEYNPKNIYKLYNIAKSGVIAYGRRTHYDIRNPISWLGRTIINGLFYILYGFKIRDVCTAYKVLPRQLLLDLDIQANDFCFSIELGIKLILGGYKVIEIPIDYYPRTTREGKAIRFKDGWRMILTMLKWRVK